MPVTGAAKTVGVVAEASGVEPLVIGKPEKPIFDLALDRLALPREQVLMVGDNLETDVLGGVRAGVQTALVLSGVTSRQDLETYREWRLASREAPEPHHVVDDLDALVDRLR